MALYRREDSGVFWYDFTVDGTRHRGSTDTKKLTEAKAIEAALIVKAREQGSTAVRPSRSPLLRELLDRFLDWVYRSKLEPSTKRYYQYGWKLLQGTVLAGMQISRITPDDVEAVRFFREAEINGVRKKMQCSAQYTNQALRTL